MSALSEAAYYAGWMMNLEHALWHAVLHGPRSYGHLDIGIEEIEQLKALSAACGGWIIFDDVVEETWMALDQWQKLYNPALARG